MADQPPSAETQPEAAPLETFTRLNGPVGDLTLLEKSLLFAELSCLSYFSRAVAGHGANEIGFPETRFYDRDGAQAYLFANASDTVIICRGTEPHEWNDIQADLDAVTDVAETIGRVHRGFKREVDDLWPRLEEALISNELPLWFAGHSLGGAMAAICAGRCKLSHINSTPEALFTYGSPRVGNQRYVNHVRLKYYRWVNNNDIVPRVPPRWLGYRHTGHEFYLDRNGRLSDIDGVLRLRDRFWGFLRSLKRWRIDHFSDHLMGEYITAIRRLMEEDNRKRAAAGGVASDAPATASRTPQTAG
ncbi:MAG: lipase family protein [Planctomycetota bacterium]